MLSLLAALGATVAMSAPVSAGTFLPSEDGVQMTADPAGGAWLWYPRSGGEQLRRIAEDGAVTAVTLPPVLRGGDLTFVSFKDGWSVATNHNPTAKRTRNGCRATFVAAELSPRSVWTKAQTLSRPCSVVESPVAVEAAGRVELGWSEIEFPGGSQDTTLQIALASIGGAFHRPMALPKAFPQHSANESAEVVLENGHLYSRATLGKQLDEAPVTATGRLGRLRHLRTFVLDTSFPTAIFEPDGAELWIYQGDTFRYELLGRLRPRGSSTLGAPTLIDDSVENGVEFAQAPDGRGLLSFRVETHASGSKIVTATISPKGKIGPTHDAVFDPAVTEGSYRWADAVDDGGDQLVVSANDGGQEEPAKLWATVATPRCPTYSSPVEVAPDFDTQASELVAVAGPRGVFHVAWSVKSASIHEVHLSSGTVACEGVGPAP